MDPTQTQPMPVSPMGADAQNALMLQILKATQQQQQQPGMATAQAMGASPLAMQQPGMSAMPVDPNSQAGSLGMANQMGQMAPAGPVPNPIAQALMSPIPGGGQ